jgi:cell fate regulator YaaT (PSP1 superfamily)
MSIVEVRFDNISNTYFFKNEKFVLKKNLTVIVHGDRGLMFGTVINIITDISGFDLDIMGDVVRISSKKDYLQHLSNIRDAKESIVKCKELVKKYKLNMTIIDANYNFDRSQLLFRFIADERVDFRALARELGSVFRTRIELRQIGIRDKAKEVGGVGPCGRRLCCSSFLTSFDSISINMAKNQSVLLNPSKINGVCGRLLCCLKYENDNYLELSSNLPNVGDKVSVSSKNGKVISVDVLKQKYSVLFEDKSVLEVDANETKK